MSGCTSFVLFRLPAILSYPACSTNCPVLFCVGSLTLGIFRELETSKRDQETPAHRRKAFSKKNLDKSLKRGRGPSKKGQKNFSNHFPNPPTHPQTPTNDRIGKGRINLCCLAQSQPTPIGQSDTSQKHRTGDTQGK